MSESRDWLFPPTRFVHTLAEGKTDRPACGPKLSDCCQCKISGQPAIGFTIYTCCRCGDQEGL